MKDAYFFSHDSNTRSDTKIMSLLSVYDFRGYGWFWAIIETMRDSTDYKLPLTSKYCMKNYSSLLRCTEEEAKEFIYDCIDEFELFESDGEFFWSGSLLRRMNKANEKRMINSENAKKGGRPKKQAEQIEVPVEEKPAPSEKIVEKTNQKKQVEKPIETEAEYEYCDDVMYLVNLLSSKMTENNPNCKLPSDFKKWYNEIRLMIDKDGYSFEQVDEMIRWSQNDSFWRSNILSADKLRKQAGKLVLGMKRTQVTNKKEPESITDTYNRLLKYVNGEDENEKGGNIEIIDVDSFIVS